MQRLRQIAPSAANFTSSTINFTSISTSINSNSCSKRKAGEEEEGEAGR